MAFLQLTLLNKSLSRFPTAKDSVINEITRVAYKNDSELLNLISAAKISTVDYFYSTDFYNYASPFSIWNGGSLNTGTQGVYDVGVTASYFHPSCIAFQSANTTNSGYRFITTQRTAPIQGGESSNHVISLLSPTSCTGYFGFYNTTGTTTPQNGVFFNLNNGTLAAVAKTSGVATSVSLMQITQGEWYRFNLNVINSGLSQFKVLDMNTSVLASANVSSNLPTSTYFLGHGITVFHSIAASATDLVICDYMDVTFKGPEIGSRGGV